MKITFFSFTVIIAFLASAQVQASSFDKKGAPVPEAAKGNEDVSSSSTPYYSPRFKNLDLNHDGKVTLEEFLKGPTDEFNRLDANKDKTLSPDEVDFSPGTPPEIKAQMRKEMQQNDLARAQQQVVDKRHMNEEMQIMKAQRDKMRQETDKGAAIIHSPTAPVAPAVTPVNPLLMTAPATTTSSIKAAPVAPKASPTTVGLPVEGFDDIGRE